MILRGRGRLSVPEYPAWSLTFWREACRRLAGFLADFGAAVRHTGVLGVAFLPLLTGCAPGGNLAMLPQPANDSYRLGTGDQIRVITYDEPQLTNTFAVSDDGTIAFPLVGNMQAKGLTGNQISANITSALEQAKLLTQPSVSVQVIAYRPISVLGEVNHPGQYPYQPGMKMLDAVALAGGFTYRAVTGHASAWRSEGVESGQAIEGKIDPSSVLEPGDVITVYERYF
jgi:polysaccharide biosynthesis/export protein